jgi:hypothetical protein
MGPTQERRIPFPVVDTAKQQVAGRLRDQADACRTMGSPLYADLLGRAADDAEAGGPTWEVLRGHEGDAWESMLPLRLTGSVHRLVLQGRAPALARHFASREASSVDAWPDFLEVLATNRDALRDLIHRPVQTNEVGRAAILLGGFVLVAEETQLPLRCLEVGASAGLNLLWDHYGYESDGTYWGDPGSAVLFRDVFEEGQPPSEVSLDVMERRGCDLQPVDPATDEGRLALLSYVWPDQWKRMERLRAALKIAARVPVTVDTADALDWIGRQLARQTPGRATVLFHSITALYFESNYRSRFAQAIEEAGRRASADAPLAWLSLELEGDRFETRLRMWPVGEDRLIALSGPHGPPVRWLWNR